MKEDKRKIVFSKCDSNEVTETLDFVLNLRDEYLFATMFKGCKWGFDRGEVCRFSKKSLLQRLDRAVAKTRPLRSRKMMGTMIRTLMVNTRSASSRKNMPERTVIRLFRSKRKRKSILLQFRM